MAPRKSTIDQTHDSTNTRTNTARYVSDVRSNERMRLRSTRTTPRRPNTNEATKTASGIGPATSRKNRLMARARCMVLSWADLLSLTARSYTSSAARASSFVSSVVGGSEYREPSSAARMIARTRAVTAPGVAGGPIPGGGPPADSVVGNQDSNGGGGGGASSRAFSSVSSRAVSGQLDQLVATSWCNAGFLRSAYRRVALSYASLIAAWVGPSLLDGKPVASRYG